MTKWIAGDQRERKMTIYDPLSHRIVVENEFPLDEKTWRVKLNVRGLKSQPLINVLNYWIRKCYFWISKNFEKIINVTDNIIGLIRGLGHSL